MNLRKAAANRQCLIRLPGCNVEPTCLAHYRMSGLSGMGMKSPDICGAWACASCHTQVDTTGRGDVNTQLAFLQGVMRTQAALIKEGAIQW